jgi:molybdenum cofactor cytidylyltransferase
MSLSVSAIITAAGKNTRMQEDLKKRGLDPKNKLLMDIQGIPVIMHTIQRALTSGIDECIVVVGHFKDDIVPVLSDFSNSRLKIVENHTDNVPLSVSLLNGVKAAAGDICLCAAGDQPTVTSPTFSNLINKVKSYENPQNILSVLSRGSNGYLDSAEGLGMPLACHRTILENYLPRHSSNLNPILREMIKDNVVFYGIPPENDMELVNVNRYDDYLLIKKNLE